MGKENRERLEDSRAINVQLQEENKHLRKKVQMYDQRMEEMEKKLETFAKLLSLLKK
jgi:predicted nuclease with TOPRIM domain